MVDTDISHAVEERLLAIETRLNALDGGSAGEPKEESKEEVDPVVDDLMAEKASSTTKKRGY
jgi:hypothetical protein